MVVIYHAFGPHYGYYLPWSGWFRDFKAPPSQPFLWFYPITFGWAGVALFFVLSGFCIHLSFLRSKNFGSPRFFWRRFWRIYPAYVIALLAFCTLNRLNIFSRSGVEQFVSHALLLHNFRESTFFGIVPAFWSIATEVQLYLLFPLLLVLRSRFGIIGCIIVTFSLGLFWRAVAVYRWGLADHVITPALSSPMMTWFDWTLGAFVAERFHHGGRAFSHNRIWLSLLIPIFVASTLYKPLTTFSFSLAATIAAIVLDAALYIPWRKHSWVTGLAFIGLISYSLYLWHQPLLYLVIPHVRHFTDSSIIAWSVLIYLMIAGSWISFRLIELAGMDIGDSLWQRLHKPPQK